MSLTAVDFIRGGVVPAVVVAVTDEGVADAASVLARELGGGVTGGEGAASLVAVVAAVVGVVADVVERYAAAVVTGEVDRRARVEGLAGEKTQRVHLFFVKMGVISAYFIVLGAKAKESKKSKCTTGSQHTHHTLSPARLSCRCSL